MLSKKKNGGSVRANADDLAARNRYMAIEIPMRDIRAISFQYLLIAFDLAIKHSKPTFLCLESPMDLLENDQIPQFFRELILDHARTFLAVDLRLPEDKETRWSGHVFWAGIAFGFCKRAGEDILIDKVTTVEFLNTLREALNSAGAT